jgi:hypothetical protein
VCSNACVLWGHRIRTIPSVTVVHVFEIRTFEIIFSSCETRSIIHSLQVALLFCPGHDTRTKLSVSQLSCFLANLANSSSRAGPTLSFLDVKNKAHHSWQKSLLSLLLSILVRLDEFPQHLLSTQNDITPSVMRVG